MDSARRGPATPARVDVAEFQTRQAHHTNPVDLLLGRLERVRQTGPHGCHPAQRRATGKEIGPEGYLSARATMDGFCSIALPDVRSMKSSPLSAWCFPTCSHYARSSIQPYRPREV